MNRTIKATFITQLDNIKIEEEREFTLKTDIWDELKKHIHFGPEVDTAQLDELMEELIVAVFKGGVKAGATAVEEIYEATIEANKGKI